MIKNEEKIDNSEKVQNFTIWDEDFSKADDNPDWILQLNDISNRQNQVEILAIPINKEDLVKEEENHDILFKRKKTISPFEKDKSSIDFQTKE